MVRILEQVSILENERNIAQQEGNNTLAGQLDIAIHNIKTSSEWCYAMAYHLALQTGESYFVLKTTGKDWTSSDTGYYCVSERDLDKTYGSYWKGGLISEMRKCSPPPEKPPS